MTVRKSLFRKWLYSTLGLDAPISSNRVRDRVESRASFAVASATSRVVMLDVEDLAVNSGRQVVSELQEIIEDCA